MSNFNYIAVRSVRMPDGKVIHPGYEIPLDDEACAKMLADGVIKRKAAESAPKTDDKDEGKRSPAKKK